MDPGAELPAAPVLRRPPRSAGCRPKKAVRDEVNQLKRILGATHKYEWQRAQILQNEIARLCGVAGPSGGLMIPRACKLCGYYGHTSQYCPHDMDRVKLALQREQADYRPLTEAQCTPEQWVWVCDLRRVHARATEAIGKGLGCSKTKPTCGTERQLECKCKDCEAWHAFMGAAPPA